MQRPSTVVYKNVHSPALRSVVVAEEELSRQFRELVRRLRIEKGYSQEEFAFWVGLHQTYISSIESGRRNVTIGTAARIVGALDTTLTGLFAEVEREPEAPPEDLRHP